MSHIGSKSTPGSNTKKLDDGLQTLLTVVETAPIGPDSTSVLQEQSSALVTPGNQPKTQQMSTSTMHRLQAEMEYSPEIAPSRQVLVYWSILILRSILCCLCNEIDYSPDTSRGGEGSGGSSSHPYDNPESSDKLNTLFVSKGVVTRKVDIDRMWKVMKESHTARFVLAACCDERRMKDTNDAYQLGR